MYPSAPYKCKATKLASHTLNQHQLHQSITKLCIHIQTLLPGTLIAVFIENRVPLKLYSESVELNGYALHPVSSTLAGVDFNIKALLSLGGALKCPLITRLWQTKGRKHLQHSPTCTNMGGTNISGSQPEILTGGQSDLIWRSVTQYTPTSSYFLLFTISYIKSSNMM